jgi:predicted nucleic acid-binding protein
LTQNGFVRIVSRSKHRDALTIVEAVRRLQIFIDQTEHAFWPDDISFLEPQRFERERILGPKQLTDIYLLALAVKNGGRLATFDQAIPLGAVRGAQTRHVAVI